METHVKTILQSMVNANQNAKKGRKRKPGAILTFTNLIKHQIATKDIVTCGLFSILPKNIAIKINDKKEFDLLTHDEIKIICDVILKNTNNNKCFIYLTENGKNKLTYISNNPDSYNKKLLDIRTIFNTQERQMILG